MSDAWYRIGHFTDHEARTGCTVILFESQVPAVADVRGGAPGTRETTLLDPGRQGAVDAIALAGGSAFGLAAADGVMRFLFERGRGFPTAGGPVPLVPSAIIFDLATGKAVHPTAEWGYRAAQSATSSETAIGLVGAGTGATVAKLGGSPTPGGLGAASVTSAAGDVHAVIVVNAVGDIVDPSTGAYLRKALDPQGGGRSGLELLIDGVQRARFAENTTIGCVMIDAPMDSYALHRAAVAAHDGLARAIVPVHTAFDGDTIFVVARDRGASTLGQVASLCAATTLAVERAIISIFQGNGLEPSAIH
jgi:L-aminopeptidase/D-esterase-like protein